MTEDDWFAAAMNDNDVVAEVLVRLRLATLPSPSKRRRPPPPPPPQSWTVHQRRSRTQPSLPSPCKSETPTASPTTPLSWSGATSASGSGAAAPTADVIDSAQPVHNCSDISRSKVRPPGETNPTKRSRKKKSLATLKEEVTILIEEQDELKKKLASLANNFEQQRKENERLKKIKLAIEVETQPKATRNNHCELVNVKTALPDLNVPFGEDLMVSWQIART